MPVAVVVAPWWRRSLTAPLCVRARSRVRLCVQAHWLSTLTSKHAEFWPWLASGGVGGGGRGGARASMRRKGESKSEIRVYKTRCDLNQFPRSHRARSHVVAASPCVRACCLNVTFFLLIRVYCDWCVCVSIFVLENWKVLSLVVWVRVWSDRVKTWLPQFEKNQLQPMTYF